MFITGLIVFLSRLVRVILAAPHGLEVIAWTIGGTGVFELCLNTWSIRKTAGLEVGGC